MKQTTKAQSEDFALAQALGDIQTAAASPKVEVKADRGEKVFASNANELTMAIGRARVAKLDYIEIDQDLFDQIITDDPTTQMKKYICYQGMKLFVAGTREKTLREESMNAEDYGNLMGRRRMDANAV